MTPWAGVCRLPGHQLLCTGIANGAGRVAPVQAKWSVTRLPSKKHHGFSTFCLQGCLWPPGCPGCLLDASWVPPGVPPRSLKIKSYFWKWIPPKGQLGWIKAFKIKSDFWKWIPPKGQLGWIKVCFLKCLQTNRRLWGVYRQTDSFEVSTDKQTILYMPYIPIYFLYIPIFSGIFRYIFRFGVGPWKSKFFIWRDVSSSIDSWSSIIKHLSSIDHFSSIHRAPLSIYQTLLSNYRALLSICRALLSIYWALLSIYRALLSIPSSSIEQPSSMVKHLSSIVDYLSSTTEH